MPGRPWQRPGMEHLKMEPQGQRDRFWRRRRGWRKIPPWREVQPEADRPPATALPGITLPEERQRAVQTVRRPASQEQPEHPGKGEPALREARNPLDVRTEAPGTAPALAAERRTGAGRRENTL